MLSCSQQSVFSAMDRFVKAVNNMSSTVLVPSKLRDMDIHSNRKMARVPPALANTDLYSFYLMLNDVKKELLWGPTTGALAAATMATNGTTGASSTSSSNSITTALSSIAPSLNSSNISNSSSSSSSSSASNYGSGSNNTFSSNSSIITSSSGFCSSTNSILNCNVSSSSNLNGYFYGGNGGGNNSSSNSISSGFVPYGGSHYTSSNSSSINFNTIKTSPSMAMVNTNTVLAHSVVNTSIVSNLSGSMSNVTLGNNNSTSRQHSRQPSDESIGSIGDSSTASTSITSGSNSSAVASSGNGNCNPPAGLNCDPDTDSEIDSLLIDRDGCIDEHTSHLATAFRHHLQGLHTILHQLADSADYLSSRYQEEIDASSL